MARPLRIEFAGALYHVTSRGDGREDIYLDDDDRHLWLDVLSAVCNRFNWAVHAYCEMTNHYHVLVETPDANLSGGMRHLNGVYTQLFNKRHGRVGHVFQGRYKAILVQKETYLLELARYIVLNPVRARMVQSAGDWSWSSYRATAGLSQPMAWLQTHWLLSAFADHINQAQSQYRQFVAAGKNQPSPWESLLNQIYLGDQHFVERLVTNLDSDACLVEVPHPQRRPAARPVGEYFELLEDRDEAIRAAFATGAYSMREIGEAAGLHYSRVSRIVNTRSKARNKT